MRSRLSYLLGLYVLARCVCEPLPNAIYADDDAGRVDAGAGGAVATGGGIAAGGGPQSGGGTTNGGGVANGGGAAAGGGSIGGGGAAVGGGAAGGGTATPDAGCAATSPGPLCTCLGIVTRPASLKWSQCVDGITTLMPGLGQVTDDGGTGNMLLAIIDGGAPQESSGPHGFIDLGGVTTSGRGRLTGCAKFLSIPPDHVVFARLKSTASNDLINVYLTQAGHLGVFSDALSAPAIDVPEGAPNIADGTRHCIDITWAQFDGVHISIDDAGYSSQAVVGSSGNSVVPQYLNLGIDAALWMSAQPFTVKLSDWLYFDQDDGGL